MVRFLLRRKTDFYFWTGIPLGMATMSNFGAAYTEVHYLTHLFPTVSISLLFLSGILAYFYFWGQNRADSKLAGGCFGGIATMIVVFNLGYNLLLSIFLF
jgi:hypothetical protein